MIKDDRTGIWSREIISIGEYGNQPMPPACRCDESHIWVRVPAGEDKSAVTNISSVDFNTDDLKSLLP